MRIILRKAIIIKQFISTLSCDSDFANEDFTTTICGAELDVITKLKKNANLSYLFKGPRTGKRGRPRVYDGKVRTNAPDKLDLVKLEQEQQWKEQGGEPRELVFSMEDHKRMKCKERLAKELNTNFGLPVDSIKSLPLLAPPPRLA